MKISFTGDISFNDDYINLYKNGEKPFSAINNTLKTQDYVVGNLECMAKGDDGENLAKKPRLTTTVETLNYLNQIPVNIVSLAQNHIYDHLDDGFNKTTEFLNKNNIKYLGASLNNTDYKKPLIVNRNDIKIGFLNYVTKDTNPNLPNNAAVNLNIFDLNTVIDEIKELKTRVNHLVLLLHWGGKLENAFYPDWSQPNIAYKLIDAGADLIVGTHSHTLQPYEVYKGKHIFYSLGNFCFANIYSDGKIKEIEWGKNTESVILNVNFTSNAYTVNFTPINNIEKKIVIDKMVLNKWNKRQKYFTIIKKYKLIWKLHLLKHRKLDPVIFYFFGNNHSFVKQLKTIKFYKFVNYIKR